MIWPLALGSTGFVISFHSFPILATGSGKGGSRWVSELTVANPHTRPLTIAHRLSYAGSYLERFQTLLPGETVRWENSLQDFWGLSGNAALYLKADSSFNGGLDSDCLGFVASLKIANVGGAAGSFSMDVPSLDVITDFIGRWPAYFTGIRHFGQAGGEGFRTNVGLWNVGSAGTLRLTLYNRHGQAVWQQTVLAERHKPVLIPLPDSLNLDYGTLVADPLGQHLFVGVFVSVVDNRTSDGLVRTSQILGPDDALVCGGVSVFQAKEEQNQRPTLFEAEALLEPAFLGQPSPESPWNR